MLFDNKEPQIFEGGWPYLADWDNGVVEVNSIQTNFVGIRYATGNKSIQSMPRKFRNTICDGKWFDIDMKYCGGVILAIICHKINESVQFNDRLRHHTDGSNIEEKLHSLGADREYCEHMMKTLPNGERTWEELGDKPKWTRTLKHEISNLKVQIVRHKQFEYNRLRTACKPKPYENAYAMTFLAHLIQAEEDEIWMTELEFVCLSKICVLACNGFQLMQATNLEALNTQVRKVFPLIVHLEFVNKPMNEGLI